MVEWRLKLYGIDGSFAVRTFKKGTTYAEVEAMRDQVLSTGRYEKVWMEEVP
jgi:hypothetical protein